MARRPVSPLCGKIRPQTFFCGRTHYENYREKARKKRVIEGTKPAEPVSRRVAQRACQSITNDNLHDNCVFDVMVTGNLGFAQTYMASQQIQVGPATTTTVYDHKDPTEVEEPVRFTATVVAGNGVPTGMVQFTLDGHNEDQPVPSTRGARQRGRRQA